jgi:Heterokaryon incompatibility protein (HET)
LGDTEDQFEYKGILSPGTIRIRLLPGERVEPLHCRLVQSRLDEQPSSAALSYVWGDLSDTTVIYCHRSILKITRSLFRALWRFRENGFDQLFWVDAISINQNDLEAKTHQVRLMLDIYKRADEVIAWPGEEEKTDSIGINLMHRIYSALPLSKLGAPRSVEDLDFGELGLSMPRDPSWTALRLILKRGWFTRVWVLQEFVMAKTCQMLCGSLKINSDMLVAVVQIILHHTSKRSIGEPDKLSGSPEPWRNGVQLVRYIGISTQPISGYRYILSHGFLISLQPSRQGICSGWTRFRRPP